MVEGLVPKPHIVRTGVPHSPSYKNSDAARAGVVFYDVNAPQIKWHGLTGGRARAHCEVEPPQS